jgi:Stage II sporulation protein M
MEPPPPVPGETGPPTQPTGGLPNALRDFLSERRILIFGIVLLAELVVFFIGTAFPISPAQQVVLSNQEQTLLNQTSNIGPLATVFAIFANNFKVALLEMIPLLGIIAFFSSIFLTGQIFQVEAISRNVPGPVIGGVLFVFPFAIVELSCYAIAVASGTMLIVALPTRRLARELRVFAVQVVAVALLLIFAATMETITIFIPLIGLAFWVPLLLLAYSLVLRVRHVTA